MKLVIIESPYAGDVDAHVAYAKRAVHDCLARNEAPLVSHLLFTQPGVLRDEVPNERMLGIEAGLSWYRVAEGCVVYTDYGISRGMEFGMARALEHNVPIEKRSIGR